MNLINFLKNINETVSQYSTEQLISFINEIGRVLPKGKRDDFLRRLKSAGDSGKSTADTNNERNSEFDKAYHKVRESLDKINSREATIKAVEDYDYNYEWYDDGDEELSYEDEDGISDMLGEACDFLHRCMDEERYIEGSEIGRQLLDVRILALNEFGDEEFSIRDMISYELLSRDMATVILDALYCSYFAAAPKKRPEILYEIFVNSGIKGISLEAVMQYGGAALPDFKEFLTEWIAYIGDKWGYEADRLLTEAVGFLNDPLLGCEYAEKFVLTHPELYLHILENEKGADLEFLISTGMKAIAAIPPKYVARSKAALKTADYIIMSNNHQNLLEQCYFAAYSSDTTAINYLRALLNGYNSEEKRGELRKVFEALPTNNSAYSFGANYNTSSEKKENKPDINTLMLLKFFDGQFAKVLAEGLNSKTALGWTGTFMKQGIALYLLYLYEGSGHCQGIDAMEKIAKSAVHFSSEEYQKGLPNISHEDDCELFRSLFAEWKAITPISPNVRTEALEKLESLIEMRTKGIMEGNHRKYYGECAAYIAALGEVQEFMGAIGAKQKLMTLYKDKYIGRNAFRAEMREYGRIDVKKK